MLISVVSFLVFSPLSSLAQKAPVRQAQGTPNWVQVAETRGGDRLYVNSESIRKSESSEIPGIQYIQQKVYAKKNSAGEIRAFTKVTAYCAVNMYRIDAHATYDNSNQIIKYVEYGTPQAPSYPAPELVPPNSVGESAVMYACSY